MSEDLLEIDQALVAQPLPIHNSLEIIATPISDHQPGIKIERLKLQFHFIISKTTFGLLTFLGLKGIFDEVLRILLKYETLWEQMNANPMLYVLVLQQFLVIGITHFISSAYGFTMIIKPSGSLQVVHTLIGIGLVIITSYISHFYSITPELIMNLQTAK